MRNPARYQRGSYRDRDVNSGDGGAKLEDEARRLRGKDISPCRLLFLDEAARLDARSIATLFELCERLQMQLIIAAPENISPEKGTTYKLVRKVFQNTEHVHVVGLRGFAPQLPETLPGTQTEDTPSEAS